MLGGEKEKDGYSLSILPTLYVTRITSPIILIAYHIYEIKEFNEDFMRKVGLSVIVISILFVASAVYADPIAEQWSSLSPCINDLRVSNNHRCCEDGCCEVTESSETWQKISNRVYLLTTGNKNSLSMLRGITAVSEYGLTFLKNVSIDSLKPLIIRVQLAQW